MDHYGRIGLSEEQADLLEVATGFCRERAPIEKVRALIEDDKGFDPDLWREITELGWLGIAIPEEYGGVGLGLGEVAPVMEQMGRRLMSSPFLSTTLAAQALLKGATETQKKSYLPRFVEGVAATLALSESNNDWDLENIAAKAEPAGDEFALSGRKVFVTDADAAEIIIVSAIFDKSPQLFIIEKTLLRDGALRRETIIDETKRSFSLNLEGVRVPKEARLDPEKASETLRHLHMAAGLLLSAEMVGAAQGVIDYTIEYLNTRKQFGKLIGSYQALKHPTVDAFVLYEQARSLTYAAAHSFSEQGAGEVAVRMAKANAEKALSFAADRSIQFHGGFGFTYDCDAQLHRRRAIWCGSQFGDAVYQRRKLAALLF